MKPIDYVLIGAFAVLLIGVAIHLIHRKKRGEGSCGCGCSGCPSAGNCPSAKAVDMPKTEENTKEEKDDAETV